MSKNPWISTSGPIQYLDDVDFKDDKMRRATITSVKDGKRIRCTVWPQFNDVELNLGDWIFVEGPGEVYEYEDTEGTPKTNYNLSVQRLAVLPVSAGNRDNPSSKTTASKRKPVF